MEGLRWIYRVSAVSLALCLISAVIAVNALDVEQSLAGQFDVHQGQVNAFDIMQCEDPDSRLMQTFKNCFGNNPTSPYLVLHHPYAQGEYIDPYYGDVFTMENDGVVSSAIKRLDLDEALVTVLRMPPKAAYFGYVSYLMTRDTSHYDTFRRGSSPNPDRQQIFGSAGDTINHNVLKSLNNDRSVWGKKVVIITATSPEVSERIEAMLSVQAEPGTLFVTEAIDQKHHIGLEKTDDDFLTIIRYAVPDNPKKSKRWLNRLSQEIQTYRVKAADDSSLSAFAEQEYKPKQANSEKRFKAVKQKLEAVITSYMQIRNPGRKLNKRAFLPTQVLAGDLAIGVHGDQCREKGINCFGDNQDTDAYRMLFFPAFSRDKVMVYVGVDHVATGNASYTNISLTRVKNFMGVEAYEAFDNAKAFIEELGLLYLFTPKQQRQLDKLAVQAIGGPNCAELFGEARCWDLSDTLIYDRTPYFFMHRAYLNPSSGNGANPNQLLTPHVLVLD